MPFIRIFPLQETEAVRPEDFGRGNPARCHAERRIDAREIWLALGQIAAWEECPLYLICAAEPNGLVNGIRIRLADGGTLVVPDDPEDEELGFAAALEQAAGGRIAEMGYSRYLGELTRAKLI
ncbi:hypothetical protein [Thiobacillus sedimenti]|uniref:Uncharacterized protein n=1 Tax=Thiobacillus sedimenti TaxID=3110231 RepID=A0ABZ1CGI3_9PROT|nr:hypothetical protein [Thiobacillus sp. SCUT-2]WRS38490.1 hypothetical protein VA613_10795 [Thiobacillus sp. SCUT-2]